MRLLKILSAVALCAALASCGGGTGKSAQPRADVCVLEADGYSIRVRRGEAGFEFIAPEGVAGTVVSFDGHGGCTITTPPSGGGTSADNAQNNDGTAADGTQKGGVSAPVSDGRGYHDWLVLAYPEDFISDEAYASVGAPGPGGAGEFEYGGAVFSISPDGECSVTRGGLTRFAMRTDGE